LYVDEIYNSFLNQKIETVFNYTQPWLSLKNYLYPYSIYNEESVLYVNNNIIKNTDLLKININTKIFSQNKYLYYVILGKIFNIIYDNTNIYFEYKYDNNLILEFIPTKIDNYIMNTQQGRDFYINYLQKNYSGSVCTIPFNNIEYKYLIISDICKNLDDYSNSLNTNLINIIEKELRKKDFYDIIDKEDFYLISLSIYKNQFTDIKISTNKIMLLYKLVFSTEKYNINFKFDEVNKTVEVDIFDIEYNENSPIMLNSFINNCKSKNFVLIDLRLSSNTIGGHANTIIIDRQRKTAERFEPHGSSSYEEEGLDYLSDQIDIILNNLFSQINLKYISPKECEYFGPQYMEIKELIKIEELSGFCITWSFFQALYRIQHPNESYNEATSNFKKLFQKFSKNEQSNKIIIGYFQKEISNLFINIQKDVDKINKKFNIDLHYKIDY
jgi:hypothetical protein